MVLAEAKVCCLYMENSAASLAFIIDNLVRVFLLHNNIKLRESTVKAIWLLIFNLTFTSTLRFDARVFIRV